MINIDHKTAAVLVAGVLVIYYTTRSDTKAAAAAVTDQAAATVDYINSGAMGGALFDATHDSQGNPNAAGRFFDWLAGIKKGVDY